jgi:hypothetical protein
MEMIEANIINEQFAQTMAARTDERCGFCYPREHGLNGEVRREWSPTWNMFINFCRKHSPAQNMHAPSCASLRTPHREHWPRERCDCGLILTREREGWKMSHTPGQWEAEREQCDPKPSPDDPGFFAINAPILNRYGPVADTMNRDHCISPDEDRANAMLISAAPDLLAALERVLSHERDIVYLFNRLGEGSPANFSLDCEKARAAITKAQS